MAFDPITGGEDVVSRLLGIGTTLIDRLIPDKTANAAAKVQLLQMHEAGDIKAMVGQLSVNQAEAANQNVFVAGWRPFVGWACGCAFIYAFILQPVIVTLMVVFHRTFDKAMLPVLDMGSMMPVLLGMLGLGVMRSFDKTQGTDNGH